MTVFVIAEFYIHAMFLILLDDARFVVVDQKLSKHSALQKALKV